MAGFTGVRESTAPASHTEIHRTRRRRTGGSSLRRFLLPLPLLALMAWWLSGVALSSSPTLDEVPHVGAGLSYLQKQDLRLNGEHPPLAKALAALPLVLTGTGADYESKSWTISERFFPAYLAQWVFGEWVLGRWNDRPRTILLARIPMVVLTLILAVVVYATALSLFGVRSGLLCLALLVSTPMVLSFGPLVLTDIPAALFSTLALLAFANAAVLPQPRRIALFGVSLAAALLVKFSCALLLLVIPIVLRYTSFRPLPRFGPAESEQGWRVFWRGLAIAAVIVYATYFVLSWNQPVDMQHRIGSGSVATVIGRLLMPPWLYLRGITMVLFTSSRPAYLFGEVLPNGVPLYFPTLLLLKSTPGFLAILAVAGSLGAWRYRKMHGLTPLVSPEHQLLWRILWISATLFAAACVLSRLNIGFRHFSIPLTLIIILLAPLPLLLTELVNRCRWQGRLVSSLVALFALSSLGSVVAAPALLPYTNGLMFGKPPYQLIGDSNLDWNQALPEVAAFAERHNLTRVLVDTYGLSNPAADVRQAVVWDCQTPSPADAGSFAILSANAVLESHNCEWLVPYLQQELGGGSMYVVKLPVTIPPARSQGGPPLPHEQRRIFGLPFDMRTLTIELTEHPERIAAAFVELEKRLAPDSIARDLYPPDEPVRWPWQ